MVRLSWLSRTALVSPLPLPSWYPYSVTIVKLVTLIFSSLVICSLEQSFRCQRHINPQRLFFSVRCLRVNTTFTKRAENDKSKYCSTASPVPKLKAFDLCYDLARAQGHPLSPMHPLIRTDAADGRPLRDNRKIFAQLTTSKLSPTMSVSRTMLSKYVKLKFFMQFPSWPTYPGPINGTSQYSKR